MNQAGGRLRSRALSVGLFFGVLGAVSVSLVQCTLTGDRIAGLNFARVSGSGCVKQCNDQYAELYKREQKRHQDAVAACSQIVDSVLRNACLQAEAALHAAKMDELGAGKLACQDRCHSQGAGSSG